MDMAEILIYYVFVPVVLAVFPFFCCIICSCCSDIPREEERNADALAQLALEVEQARTLAAAELAGRLAAAAAEQAHRLAAAAATPAVKLELGYFPYSAAVEGGMGRASGQRQIECAICLEVFVDGATCSEVPSCKHLFHRDCVARWMRTKSTCPLCRVRVVPGSEPLSAAEDMV